MSKIAKITSKTPKNTHFFDEILQLALLIGEEKY